MTRTPITPVYVTDLIPEMREALLRILSGLTDEQWQQPTACEGWSVKDVALHLMSDDFNLLSNLRDKDGEWSDLQDWDALVGWINTRNEKWVVATRHISKVLLVELLRFSGAQVADYFRSLDPEADSGIQVSWAGDGKAPVWLEIAREYTEYWMHHQHICEALDINSLTSHRYLHPMLDISLRALPHTYRNMDAPDGTHIMLEITGAAADSWHLLREGDTWQLYADIDTEPACHITLFEDTAWHLLTKGITPQTARSSSTITGDAALAAPFFEMISIIA
ncbi:MAG: maleylpyruvate isomerase family mycothiol-dependent enzyme [Aggregatilineales bacterium]